jgi:hypothetical protein
VRKGKGLSGRDELLLVRYLDRHPPPLQRGTIRSSLERCLAREADAAGTLEAEPDFAPSFRLREATSGNRGLPGTSRRAICLLVLGAVFARTKSDGRTLGNSREPPDA